MPKYYCPECRNPATSGTVQCTKCSQWWHPKCAKITLGLREKLEKWLCLNCDFPTSPLITSDEKLSGKVTQKASPRSVAKNTPIVTPRSSNPQAKIITRPSKKQKTPCVDCGEYIREISALRNKCSTLENELSARDSVIDKLDNEVRSVSEKLAIGMQERRKLDILVDEKKTTIDSLKMQINQSQNRFPLDQIPSGHELGTQPAAQNNQREMNAVSAASVTSDMPLPSAVNNNTDIAASDENNVIPIDKLQEEDLHIIFEKIIKPPCKRECWFFRNGFCKRGASCKFAHENKVTPINKNRVRPCPEQPKSKGVCKFFEEGTCKFGIHCRFLHPCYSFLAKSCSSIECVLDHIKMCPRFRCLDENCRLAHFNRTDPSSSKNAHFRRRKQQKIQNKPSWGLEKKVHLPGESSIPFQYTTPPMTHLRSLLDPLPPPPPPIHFHQQPINNQPRPYSIPPPLYPFPCRRKKLLVTSV